MENKEKANTAENKHFEWANKNILFKLSGDLMVWKQDIFVFLQEASTWNKTDFVFDSTW